MKKNKWWLSPLDAEGMMEQAEREKQIQKEMALHRNFLISKLEAEIWMHENEINKLRKRIEKLS